MISEKMFRLKKNGEPYKYCFCRHPELIENYEAAIADTSQTWECHHRMEAIYTRAELIKYGLYYDREPHQLIFLTHADHIILHKKGRKRGPHSEETKAKISAAKKGKKLGPHSEEHKANISATAKGRIFSEETKAKMSAAKKGKHWKIIDGHRIWY